MTSNNRILVNWLLIVGALVYLMIVVGGVTRLTQSGLSMVNWQPVMGVLPPVGQQAWQAAFTEYQQYPEYQKVNRGMTLDEFKGIFYWEYSHRLLGRLLGLVFLIPLITLHALGRIAPRWLPRLWVLFALGGLQGLMGWYMVQSGLVDVPRVSHYRLAIHLLLALFIMTCLLWLILDIRGTARVRVPRRFSLWLSGLTALLTLQLLIGVFAAGLKAGHGFNTWPLMHGQWLADAALMMQPAWLNFLENGVMIQFLHRWLGLLLVVLVLGVAWWAGRRLVKVAYGLLALTLIQFLLGVLTLINQVPVVLGSLHQAVGCLMLLLTVYLLYLTRPGDVTAACSGAERASAEAR